MPLQPTTLPNPPTFLTNLLSTLSALPPPPTTPPTIDPTSLTPAKAPLLTLHALYPTLLLPALDLLDRKLLTRLVSSDSANVEATEDATTAPKPPQAEPPPASPENAAPRHRIKTRRSVYYVQSAHAPHLPRGRYSARAGTTKSYEVRPLAWSCTCAAFAFSAAEFVALDWEGSGDNAGYYDMVGGEGDDEMLDRPASVDDDDVSGEIGDGLGWGGLMRRGVDVPLCKHLLAVVLAEWWGVAGLMVEERCVDRGEMAGWAAGWAG